MKQTFQVLLLLCMAIVTSCKQKTNPNSFKNIGDPPPPLRVQRWIKGIPVKSFEKGKIYVVEFWATWCGPCKTFMPHLSALAHQYKDRVTFVAIDVYEQKTTTIKQIKAVVDSMGNKMDFAVAIDDNNFMAHKWVDTACSTSIPSTFVVNAEGDVAWIGHPKDLDEVLRKILTNTWDIKRALSKRVLNDRLEALDEAITQELNKYVARVDKPGDVGKTDTMILVINELIKKEPKLKYARNIAYYYFRALLLTNQHSAYEYGKKVMVTPTYADPAWDCIIDDIRFNVGKLKIEPEIFRLGAECYQAQIDAYGTFVDIPSKYRKMANWYKLAGDKSKAIEAEQKAIKLSK